MPRTTGTEKMSFDKHPIDGIIGFFTFRSCILQGCANHNLKKKSGNKMVN